MYFLLLELHGWGNYTAERFFHEFITIHTK